MPHLLDVRRLLETLKQMGISHHASAPFGRVLGTGTRNPSLVTLVASVQRSVFSPTPLS